jgi:5-methyltetrahydropteroyltriglutamate--homocysteine methyltransferase
VTYPIAGLTNLDPNGVVIPFEDGHSRQLPAITSGPFEYATFAVEYFERTKELAPAGTKIKQAIIAPSALTLLYPSTPIDGYSREEFVSDVIRNGIRDIRLLLDSGADSVQLDFTEGRLSLKLDPSGGLLNQFMEVNEQVISAFDEEERKRIGIHTCPGADHDSTHSADIPYEQLLPTLFNSKASRFYLELKSEKDPEQVLTVIRDSIRPYQTVFIGVTDVNHPRIETPEEIASFVEVAAKYIPLHQLGTTDDCGFSPFCDDVSTAREIAFAKIKARIEGTKLAASRLSK